MHNFPHIVVHVPSGSESLFLQYPSLPQRDLVHLQICYRFQGNEFPPVTDVRSKIRKILSSRLKGETGRNTDKTLHIHRQRLGAVRRAHERTDTHKEA